MNILVLGASSSIGKSITKSFANKNKLFLLSTNIDKLNELKNELLSFGSQGVNLFEFDLGTPINVDEIIEENIDKSFETLFLNQRPNLSQIILHLIH